jgi:hypothetical protein
MRKSSPGGHQEVFTYKNKNRQKHGPETPGRGCGLRRKLRIFGIIEKVAKAVSKRPKFYP